MHRACQCQYIVLALLTVVILEYILRACIHLLIQLEHLCMYSHDVGLKHGK